MKKKEIEIANCEDLRPGFVDLKLVGEDDETEYFRVALIEEHEDGKKTAMIIGSGVTLEKALHYTLVNDAWFTKVIPFTKKSWDNYLGGY